MTRVRAAVTSSVPGLGRECGVPQWDCDARIDRSARTIYGLSERGWSRHVDCSASQFRVSASRAWRCRGHDGVAWVPPRGSKRLEAPPRPPP